MSRSSVWAFLGIFFVTSVVFFGDYLVRRELAGSYAEFAERFVKLGDYREATLLLNKRFAENFTAVALVNGSEEIFHLPPEHNYRQWPEGKFILGIPDTDKSLVFWYGFQTAILISVLANLFLALVIYFSRKTQERRLRVAAYMEKKVEMADLLEQVSHDIRSPLSALNIAVTTARNIDEERKSIVTAATKRVNDIADSLLRRVKQEREPSARILLGEFIESLLAEKRMELGAAAASLSLEPGTASYELDVESVGFARVLSNLINNSLQAGAKSVSIGVNAAGRFTCIRIKDDGPGVPPHVLKRLGKEPISGGKAGSDGFGLGLWSAYIFAARSGGRLEIKSSPAGTAISLFVKAPQGS